MPKQGPDQVGLGTGTLLELIRDWQDIQQRVADTETPDIAEQMRERQEQYAERIRALVLDDPHAFYNFSVNHGFDNFGDRFWKRMEEEHPSFAQRHQGGTKGGTSSLPGDRGQEQAQNQGGSGQGGDRGDGRDGGGGGGGNGPSGPGHGIRHQVQDNRLLGTLGKEFELVRGPKGTYVAVYTYRIDGEAVPVGLSLGKNADALRRFGLDPSQAKRRTAAQMKRIEHLGSADELAPYMRRGDKTVFDHLNRYLDNQYGGQPMRHDHEVMGVVIANSMFGWSSGEFENQLRQTKWYRGSNEYQRDWATTTSPKQKQDTIKLYMGRVVNDLEENYGLDWIKHVEGGMATARKWAEKIASGEWGDPGTGFEYWSSNQFDKAAKIEGTNAWLQRQQEEEARNKLLNRPADMFERLRSEALSYLGEDKNQTPRVDRSTLMRWANDLVTGERSDGDWADFLRQQMKSLYPYFDANYSFVDQAAKYKSALERTIGDNVGWDDDLLRDFSQLDVNGKPTGSAMSLRDFDLMVRDPDRNPRAYEEGTPLFDEGMDRLASVLQTMRGVS